MSTTHEAAAESVAVMAAKAAPPAGVSIATLMGVSVSELVLWATLIYTVLMIAHKVMEIWRDLKPCPTGPDE
jgi:hypothetical protein